MGELIWMLSGTWAMLYSVKMCAGVFFGSIFVVDGVDGGEFLNRGLAYTLHLSTFSSDDPAVSRQSFIWIQDSAQALWRESRGPAGRDRHARTDPCPLTASMKRRKYASGSSGNLLSPSPPAEKATAREDQAGKASTGDGGRHVYEAEIIGGLKRLARGGKMLIVRPETRLLSISGSKVRVLGTWHRRVGAPLAPTCVRARTGPNAS